MDLAAQRTQPLMPAFASKTSSASGHKVRRTLGWKQPSGLARRELLTPTLSPSCNREPLATLMSGRPTKVTPRPSDTPLSRASKAQNPENEARPRFSTNPAYSAQPRFGMGASIPDKAGRAKSNCQGELHGLHGGNRIRERPRTYW